MGKLIVFIVVIIVLPILADIISNLITMDMIMKCIYFVLGLAIINFIKEGR